MDFALSDEQVLIHDSFRDLLKRAVSLDRIRDVVNGQADMDRGLWQELCELGMPGLLVPEQYGGAGLGLLEAAVVAEELGRSVAPVPFVATAVMAPLALISGGSPEQQASWLPGMVSGALRVGVAVSEIAGGVRRDGGVMAANGTLNGRATFALDGGDVDGYLIADEKCQLHIVKCDAPGLIRHTSTVIDGTRSIAELQLEGVRGEPLKKCDNHVVRRIIDAGRIILAAESLGAGEAMLEQAVEYSKNRRQFDRVIGSFQAVKHMCAEMAAELQPCRALVWYAAYAFDSIPQEAPLSAVLAKSHIDDVGRFVARTATEVHGGMGFTDLLGLHFSFKRIAFNRAMLGGPERLREEAARLQNL